MIRKTPYNIIFVTISMTGGGTERVIATLSNFWCEKGHSVHILMIGGDDIAYELDESVDVRSISGATEGSVVARLGRIKKLRDEFKKDDSSIIIAMGTVASMFSSVSAFGLKNRLILSERNDPNRLNHRPIKGYEKILRNVLYNKADSVVFQTNMALECFPKRIRDIGQVIMNPIRHDLPEGKDYPERRKVVMTAGRLTEQKNHKLLIDAFIKTRNEHPEYRLEIYGEGEDKHKLEEYIKDKGIEDIISFKGFSDDLLSVMRDTRIYVSSSDWEGISNSLTEAMACGMAVIATDCPMGGSAMLIRDGENGILTIVGDLDAISIALNRLMSDESFAYDLSDQTKKVREDLIVENIAKKWEALFTDQ